MQTDATLPEELEQRCICFVSLLWHRCILIARHRDNAPAEAVQTLITESRNIIAAAGCAEQSDLILYSVYIALHWDYDQPTDRVFEMMLGFELENFLKERMN